VYEDDRWLEASPQDYLIQGWVSPVVGMSAVWRPETDQRYADKWATPEERYAREKQLQLIERICCHLEEMRTIRPQDAHPKCHKTRTIWTAQLEILQNQIETLSIIVDAEKHGLSGHE
jgi:hypothetical protein